MFQIQEQNENITRQLGEKQHEFKETAKKNFYMLIFDVLKSIGLAAIPVLLWWVDVLAGKGAIISVDGNECCGSA